MKNTYVKPMATTEEFVANEFVAICCYLACDLGAANENDYRVTLNEKHTKITVAGGSGSWKFNVGEGCGWAKNQVFRGSKATGYKIVELNAPGEAPGTELATNFTSPNVSNFTEAQINQWAQDGTKLYWSTTNSYRVKYNHVGSLSPIDPKHPGRS